MSVQPLFPSRVKQQRLEGRCGRSRLQPSALRPGQQEDWEVRLGGLSRETLKNQDNREDSTARQGQLLSGETPESELK